MVLPIFKTSPESLKLKIICLKLHDLGNKNLKFICFVICLQNFIIYGKFVFSIYQHIVLGKQVLLGFIVFICKNLKKHHIDRYMEKNIFQNIKLLVSFPSKLQIT